MNEAQHLTFSSELNAPPITVWNVVGRMSGVNAELAPWLRMTAPRAALDVRIEDAPLGRPLFASWVLLFGVVPIDRHRFLLASVDPGRGFVEDSTSWSQRRWEHRRLVEAHADGCILTDRLTFRPRVSFLGPILQRVIGAIFRHRHRRLRQRFARRPGLPS